MATCTHVHHLFGNVAYLYYGSRYGSLLRIFCELDPNKAVYRVRILGTPHCTLAISDILESRRYPLRDRGRSDFESSCPPKMKTIASERQHAPSTFYPFRPRFSHEGQNGGI